MVAACINPTRDGHRSRAYLDLPMTSVFANSCCISLNMVKDPILKGSGPGCHEPIKVLTVKGCLHRCTLCLKVLVHGGMDGLHIHCLLFLSVLLPGGGWCLCCHAVQMCLHRFPQWLSMGVGGCCGGQVSKGLGVAGWCWLVRLGLVGAASALFHAGTGWWWAKLLGHVSNTQGVE